ncbi:diguanylate cyclase (GGDEF)-like protein/PAS domain S-box-containing protein [Tardiphaga robiniae]|uniref:EAL domain-containing protein n=1 Tax=Tardiphaga robiniae TaxID=943830 RepID=UPI0028658A30|nr:EAL domain-containing protein [Tardiphaga robiniae]MDR6657463.1 diguanylate cyclase (GGDEF)-like protein/PAS domain S-box-containing protein [Tardiphaga robiniae]
MTLVHVDQSDAARTLLAGLEQAIDAVVMIDSKNSVTHFNAAAEQLWGYERDEVLGRNISFLVPMAIRTQHDGYIAANRATGVNRIVGHSREVKIERKDGSEIWGSLSMSRVEVNGEITYMGFVRDVTEEVKRREEIIPLALVVDKTKRAIYIAGRDARICYVNGAFTGMFGYALDEATGLIPEEFLVGAYTSQATLAYLDRQIRTEGSAEDEILLYDKAGNEVWVSVALNAIHGADGKIQHLVALMTDITESKQLQSLQHHILEALADEQPLLDVMDNLCRKVEQIAPDVVCSVLHVDSAGLLHPLGGPSLPAGYAQALDGIAIGPDVGSCGTAAFRGEPVLVTDIENDPLWLPYNSAPLASGLKACWSMPIKTRDGRVIGTFAFYFRECRRPSRLHHGIVDACVHLAAVAIEREEARNEISRLAYFDALTGLPNRTHMRQLMERAVAECSADAQMALIFLDLDHFKDVNDTLGHAVGDDLLVAVTQRLRQHIRPGDILSRQGGDEFIILMPNCVTADASRIAGRLTEALSVPLQLGGHQVPISASAGISMFPDNARDLDSLLKYADAAMYKAKQAGRSTHRFFSNDMDRVNEERLRLSAALRHALAQGGLRLHYQPQIRAGSGDLYGVEALARWHDPVLGDVSPAKFIPLAEECGLIEQIGVWSLREACRQIAAWQKAGLDVPCVSVNLSPINFLNPGLPALISDIIAENGLAPNRLMLEVTEGAVMSEHTTAIEIMMQIRAAGIGLSMDDFGTGYSSLSRLAHLPVRELKIDRSFMRGIETEVCALAITTAIVCVGQSLNMTVVAEGVETEEQRRILAGLGCDVIQGFLYSPALSAFDLEAWLVARHAERWAALVDERRAEAAQEEMWPGALAAM